MTTTDLSSRVRAALGEHLQRDPRTIRLEDHLRDDLGLDSMATIELLFRIEEAFDIQIPDEDLQQLRRVGDVISYVQERLPPASPGARTVRSAKPVASKKKSSKRA